MHTRDCPSCRNDRGRSKSRINREMTGAAGMFAFPWPDLTKIIEEVPQCCRRHPWPCFFRNGASHENPALSQLESHQGCRQVVVTVGQNPAEIKIDEFSASCQFSFTLGLAKIGSEQHRPTLPTRDHGIRGKLLDTAKMPRR